MVKVPSKQSQREVGRWDYWFRCQYNIKPYKYLWEPSQKGNVKFLFLLSVLVSTDLTTNDRQRNIALFKMDYLMSAANFVEKDERTSHATEFVTGL